MDELIAENKNIYDRIAGHFSATRRGLWNELLPFKNLVKNGDRILDVGCGNGRLYQLFDNLSIDYVGLDQSKNLLAEARKKFPSAQFIVGEMSKLPFAEDSFDIIFCIAAFHHLPSDELRMRTLKEMKRVLRANGKIVMTNWNGESDWITSKISYGKIRKLMDDAYHFIIPWKNNKGEVKGLRHYWLLPPDDFTKLMLKVGLKMDDQYYVSRGERTDKKHGMHIISIISL